MHPRLLTSFVLLALFLTATTSTHSACRPAPDYCSGGGGAGGCVAKDSPCPFSFPNRTPDQDDGVCEGRTQGCETPAPVNYAICNTDLKLRTELDQKRATGEITSEKYHTDTNHQLTGRKQPSPEGQVFVVLPRDATVKAMFCWSLYENGPHVGGTNLCPYGNCSDYLVFSGHRDVFMDWGGKPARVISIWAKNHSDWGRGLKIEVFLD